MQRHAITPTYGRATGSAFAQSRSNPLDLSTPQAKLIEDNSTVSPHGAKGLESQDLYIHLYCQPCPML